MQNLKNTAIIIFHICIATILSIPFCMGAFGLLLPLGNGTISLSSIMMGVCLYVLPPCFINLFFMKRMHAKVNNSLAKNIWWGTILIILLIYMISLITNR